MFFFVAVDGNGNSKDNSKRVLARLKTHQRWPFPLAPLKHKEHHSEGRVGVARVFVCARLLSEALEGLRDLLAVRDLLEFPLLFRNNLNPFFIFASSWFGVSCFANIFPARCCKHFSPSSFSWMFF